MNYYRMHIKQIREKLEDCIATRKTEIEDIEKRIENSVKELREAEESRKAEITVYEEMLKESALDLSQFADEPEDEPIADAPAVDCCEPTTDEDFMSAPVAENYEEAPKQSEYI